MFFKWIKQHLKVKTLLGTSKNAVLTQIWIALCVYLIVAFLKLRSKIGKSMYKILRVLQMNLFDCVFQTIPANDSTANRPLIPRDSGHRFHFIPASDSMGIRPPLFQR